MDTQTSVQPTREDAADFDLDVSIVEAGDAVNALLGGTDNGCDTVRGSDC